MRKILQFFLLGILLPDLGFAQSGSFTFLGDPTPCTSHAVQSTATVTNSGASWEVQNTNVPDSLLPAIHEAVRKWQSWIVSNQPVKVLVSMDELGNEVLAGTQFEQVLISTNYMNGNGWYPTALARQLVPTVPFHGGLADICIRLNRNLIEQGAFYKGLDGYVPSQQFDLITLVAHELAHGLGLSSSLRTFGAFGLDENGEDPPCVDAQNAGCFGYKAPNGQVYMTVMDRGLVGIAGNIFSQSIPSLTYLNMTSSPLYHTSANGNFQAEQLYAPPLFIRGSSINHWKTGTGADALLLKDLDKGIAIHAVGDRVCRFMYRIGWGLQTACGKYAQLLTSGAYQLQLFRPQYSLVRQPFRVENAGNVPLTITGFNATQNFAVVELPFPFTLQPGTYYDGTVKIESYPRDFYDLKIQLISNAHLKGSQWDSALFGTGYLSGQPSVALDLGNLPTEVFYVGEQGILTPSYMLSDEYPNLKLDDFSLQLSLDEEMLGGWGSANSFWYETAYNCDISANKDSPLNTYHIFTANGQTGCQQREGAFGLISFIPKKSGIYPVMFNWQSPNVAVTGGVRYIEVRQKCGDVNQDGQINDDDLSVLAYNLFNNTALNPDQQWAANINGNSTISIRDLRLLFAQKKGGPALNGCAVPSLTSKSRSLKQVPPTFTIQLPNVIQGVLGQETWFDVTVPTGIGKGQVESLAFDLESSSDVLELLDAQLTGTMAEDGYVATEKVGNKLRIQMVTAQMLNGSGTLLKVKAKLKKVGDSGLQFASPIAVSDEVSFVAPPPSPIPTASEMNELPDEVGIKATYPNPFNNTLTVEFQATIGAPLHVALYNVLGQQVLSIEDGIATQSAYKTSLNTASLAGGVYFLQFTSGKVAQQQKITLLR